MESSGRTTVIDVSHPGATAGQVVDAGAPAAALHMMAAGNGGSPRVMRVVRPAAMAYDYDIAPRDAEGRA